MKYRFLIYISYSYAFPIGEPLEQEILRRGYEVNWFADEEETKAKFSGEKQVLKNIKEAIDYQPHVVLSITNSIADFLPGLKVQVFHGFETSKRNFKKGHFRIRGFFDLYCTHGPSTTEIFMELKKEHKYFEVRETGWPKLDPLFPVRDEPRERPCILIASTFTKKLSLAHNDELIEEISRLSKLGKWEFKVVLHPKLEEGRVKKFTEIQNKNLTYYETTNLIPLFRKADVLLADSTSVITEFLLQEKPVVTFRNSKPGPQLINITKVEDVEAALAEGLDPQIQLLEKIRNFNQEVHPYQDGLSSKRLIDASLEFLHANKNGLKPKPLNLIRKFQERKKLKYFTLKSYRKAPTF
ncbi:CDP-glycerol glycerophosphotransferase [Salinimicrobium sp. CDJ15-81-2]|nr:CDP-glycerol glycerophosphotransferase [Salinimicrobium nanhaiense]